MLRFAPFAPLRVTRGWWRPLLFALVSCASARPLAAQLHGQHWTVTPETERATVGDTVTLAFRVRLDERDLLFDTVPKPARTLPDWIRVFGVEKLQRQPDRIYVGKARIAFYRPGRQAVPLFSLPFMRSVKGLSRGTLTSDSATVEVVPVLSAGSSATLRDIKEPAVAGKPDPLALALGVLALIVAGWLTWRARRRRPPAVAEPLPAPVSAFATRDPYDVALDRLLAIERQRWSASDVARHYAEVTDVLRDYLEAHGVPARERTTSELRWTLAPGLFAGRGRRRFETVFDAADLVKFAHWRPETEEAEGFLVAARKLLASWRESGAGSWVSAGVGGALSLLVLVLALAEPVSAQTLEVRPDSGRVTVGDPVSLRVILRQYEGDALLEQVPHPVAALADGVRLLGVDSMRQIGTRLLEARARIAFYRPGPQTIPPFAIDFRRGAVILHGTMRSEPVPIEIAAVLTDGGGPTLRDIRELAEMPGPDPRLVVAIAAAFAGAAWALRRRRGRRALVPVPALATVDVAAGAPDPFADALCRLAEIDRAGWPEAGEVVRHYEAVADALRDYLEAAASIPARERTTTELRWSLPPELLEEPRGRRFDPLFGEADLVKFARLRPTAGDAAAFLRDARSLLAAWGEALGPRAEDTRAIG